MRSYLLQWNHYHRQLFVIHLIYEFFLIINSYVGFYSNVISLKANSSYVWVCLRKSCTFLFTSGIVNVGINYNFFFFCFCYPVNYLYSLIFFIFFFIAYSSINTFYGRLLSSFLLLNKKLFFIVMKLFDWFTLFKELKYFLIWIIFLLL